MSTGQRLALAALALLLALATAAVAVLQGWGRTPQAPADPSEALSQLLDRSLQRGASSAPGLAIRPLAAASAPAEEAAMANAVCAAMSERLARLPTLRVVPCRSTAVAVAARLDDRQLGRLLAVGHVLRGELRELADARWQVSLSLHQADGGREVWRLEEAVASGDLQALPSRVAQAAGQAMGLTPTSLAEPIITPAHYAKYLKAQTLGRRVALDDRREALRLLDEVLAAEPEHVPSLFLRQNLRGFMLGNMDDGGRAPSVAELNAARAANVEQGLALARRIVAAHPTDLRGQWLLLGNEIEQRQWAQGFDRVDAMLRVAGRDPGLLRLAARLHLHAGYVRRAAELARDAARLNALDSEAIEIMALAAGIERRDAEMRELIAVAGQIGHQGMGRAEVFDAFRRQDWATLERVHTAWVSWGDNWPADWVPAFVRGLADPAQREAAAQLLDGHAQATRQHFVSYFIEYALLGDATRSLKSVQHHAKLPPATWMQHLWWPELAAVREQPGFVEAMHDLGKTGLWAARGAPDLCQRAEGADWVCH